MGDQAQGLMPMNLIDPSAPEDEYICPGGVIA
jgi:hypothetical protein